MYFYIERVINYLNRSLITRELIRRGTWYRTTPQAECRYEIYDYVFDRYVKQPVDYLEFGVYRGQSIRWCLSRLGLDSNLYGFDSFEGLPEDWYYKLTKGEFDIGGELPLLVAPNLRFVKGWFEDSLKLFLAETTLRPNLVLHMDADIYSATIYVFRTMKDRIIPGTIVIFDEYWFVKDEFRALQDFIRESGKKFEYLAITDARAAIRFTT